MKPRPFPPTQQHLADALGLSLAHTNKTLRKLQRRGVYSIEEGASDCWSRGGHWRAWQTCTVMAAHRPGR